MLGAAAIGVIDIGSCAIRLEVSAESSGVHAVLLRARERVALGEPVFRTGRITRRTTGEAARAVARLASIARDAGVTELVAVGTAALREAQNREEVVESIEREADVRIEVISGAEEAELLARAALSSPALAHRELVCCDIGGGSTELTLVRNGELSGAWSIPVGAVRLAQLFQLGPDRPARRELRNLEAYIDRALTSLPSGVLGSRDGAPLLAVGSSGSIRALARYRGDEKSAFSKRFARDAYDALARMSREERAKIDHRRADVLVGASAIAAFLMERFGIEEMLPTNKGLATGVALRLRKKVAPIADRTRVSRHAQSLFHAVEPELGLDDRERELFAAMLRPAPQKPARIANKKDRAVVKKLGAIAGVAAALDHQLGDTLGCIDVALARGEGLLILRTRDSHSSFRALPKRTHRNLERALGRRISISVVPLLDLGVEASLPGRHRVVT